MDTLGYAKRLRDAGISQQHAEAHAEAARDFVMAELVTKTDLHASLQASTTDLQGNIQALKAELQTLKAELQSNVQALKAELQSNVQALKVDLQAFKADLQAVEARLESKIDTQTLRLTVRLGGLLAAGIAFLAAVLKLT
jgi:hypothetical protein